jgi:hypothetical protein
MRSNRRKALGILALIITVLASSPESWAQTNPLPPGHPPLGGAGARPEVPPPPSGSGTGMQGLVWKIPPGWTQETPASSMRRAQYRIPGPGGPAECAVFYFGPGQGGDAKSNAERWIEQFRRADGGPVGDAAKRRDIKVGGTSVLLVEVSGTFVGGMGGGPAGPERPNQMLLGAIAEGPDANWFFRAIGPRTTLESQRAAFEAMIRSIRRGQPM